MSMNEDIENSDFINFKDCRPGTENTSMQSRTTLDDSRFP